MENISKDSVVTLDLQTQSSNTFIVDTIEGDTLLLTHPLSPGILIRVRKEQVNIAFATIKDSTERAIDFANQNRQYLDYQTISDLEALAIYFAVKRKFTLKQKQVLATICGVVAEAKFNNNIREAMNFITKNQSLLDDFNLMWYNNFKGLFTGQQPMTSTKQRGAIFNIAGYVLAELENPTAERRK